MNFTKVDSRGEPKPFAASFSAFFQMTKPTISLLVAFTVLPGLVLASDSLPSLGLSVLALVGTYLASASAAMFNHIVDSDIDADMLRTSGRPLPSGAVSEPIAVIIALLIGILSFGLLFQFINPLTAWISLAANLFYVVVYTCWLKRSTTQNIVIGGAAGAVGPLIGCAAVTGTISWEAWVLFAIVFFWTPPHFWALAIKYADDYKKANIPMLPSVKGIPAARRQIFIYTLVLIPLCLSLFWPGQGGWVYLVVSSACTLYFSYLAYLLLREKTEQAAMRVFFFSLIYLFVIFGILALEQFLLRFSWV